MEVNNEYLHLKGYVTRKGKDGYGFIRASDERYPYFIKDIFFHASQVNIDWENVKTGQKVTCGLVITTHKGHQAFDVVIPVSPALAKKSPAIARSFDKQRKYYES